MRTFVYERAANPSAAAHLAAAAAPGGENRVKYLAGGTTLFDLMKLDVMQPELVIDINPLASTALWTHRA